MTVGDTDRDPLALTADPPNVIVVAFDVAHCSVVLWPLWIAVGIAVSRAVGIGTGGGVAVTPNFSNRGSSQTSIGSVNAPVEKTQWRTAPTP